MKWVVYIAHCHIENSTMWHSTRKWSYPSFLWAAANNDKKKGMWKRWKWLDIRPSHTVRRTLLQDCPHPQPLRQTQNVVIFLGCLFRQTEAIAKGSGGNKWQANAETGRVGEETQSISAQKRYRIFFLYGLSLQACLYFRTLQPKGTGKYHIRRSGISCGAT